MRKLLATGVAVGLLVAGAPAAHAHPDFDYIGGCRMVVANDETPGGQLGGPDVWNGVVAVVAVAMRSDGIRPAPTAPITASCELRVNSVSQGTVLSSSGTGVAINAGTIQFTAGYWDWVELCEHVTVNGEAHVSCWTASTTQLVPQPIVDLVLNLLTQAVDPLTCPIFGIFSPGIGPLSVTPEGDVYVVGAKVYDCPPYWDPGFEQLMWTQIMAVL